MIVYKITNKINGKQYIGQTVSSLAVRWSQHIHYALKNKGKSVLSLAIRKYGKENFKVEIMVRCSSIDQMNHREQFYIKLFKTLAPIGYNLDSGGKNKKMHNSTKEKLSAARLGKKVGSFTAEHRKSISDALKKAGIHPILTQNQIAKRALSQTGEGNGMFGKNHSNESRLLMSANKKGKKVGKDNPFFGKKHSEETKEKIRQAKLKRNI